MRRTLLLAFGLLLPIVALAVVEVLLRALDVAAEESQAIHFDGAIASDAPVTVFDREVLYRLAPNSNLLDYYETNSRGYRGKDFGKKEAGVFRIATVGDSCTFGLGVPEDLTFARRLERALNVAFEGVQRFDVVNLGVPGYSSFQNRRQVEDELAPLGVDLVLFMPTGYNDGLLARAGSDAALADRFHSWRYRLAQMRIARLAFGSPKGFASEGAKLAIFEHGEPRVAIPDTARNVILASSAAQRLGIAFVLLRAPLTIALQNADPTLRDRHAQVAELARDLVVADPTSRFTKYAPYSLHVDVIHPSAEGHEILAEQLLATLLEAKLLPKSPRRDWLQHELSPLLAASGPAIRADDATPSTAASEGEPSEYRRLVAALGSTPPTVDSDASAVEFDPLVGTHRAEFELGRLRLVELARWVEPGEDSAAARERAGAMAREIAGNVVLPDVFHDALFTRSESGAEIAPTRDSAVARARAITIFLRSLGFERLQVDGRVARAEALAESDPGTALKLLEAAAPLAPTAFLARAVRIHALRKSGKIGEAYEAAKELEASHPEDPRALAQVGILALFQAKVEEAKDRLRRSLVRDPVSVEAHYGLARIALFESDFKDALWHLGAVRAIQPGLFPDLDALTQMASAQKRLERINR